MSPSVERQKVRPLNWFGLGLALGVCVGATMSNLGAGMMVGVLLRSRDRPEDRRSPSPRTSGGN